jgi:fumarate hydratase class II
MLNQRYRVIVWAVAALVGIWLVSLAGWWISGKLKVTPEKVQAYVDSVQFGELSAAERAKAIQSLAEMLNKLSLEERQRLRADRTTFRWFEQMTEEEKGQFIEATMPTGFKQMINAFEQLPEDRRRRAIDDAMNRLRETNKRIGAGQTAAGQGTNRPPAISEELQAKIRTIGLKTFYSQSSAQTKAELAPVLEELQRAMESGRMMRGR